MVCFLTFFVWIKYEKVAENDEWNTKAPAAGPYSDTAQANKREKIYIIVVILIINYPIIQI